MNQEHHAAQAGRLSVIGLGPGAAELMTPQVQAAIAAEPKPIHVPRDIKPVVVVDEGPLVLVETRKDLRNMPLPFEAQ